jgi:gluconate 2-dehydrogenase gamma chain
MTAMNNKNELSRRGFLQSAAAITGASYLRIGTAALASIAQNACSAKQAGSAFVSLGTAEAADFAAIAARIIPTTDTPGANEASVIHFFDRAFAEEKSLSLQMAREGLAELNESLRNGTHFANLDDAKQDAALGTIETSAFFNFVREMTIFGFFAMSSYGGNKDNVAWDLIGFEGHHGAWAYPFGYYDTEVHGGSFDGE